MTKYAIVSILFSVTFFLQSCKEEITLSSNYEEVPVVYGLLDQSDSLHFIKINRGFIGPGNALEISKIADSNYFENVNAKIEELVNNVVTRSWTLRDTLLTTKDTDGVFYSPNYKAYYFDSKASPLIENATYRLTVDINEGKLVVNGETKLISGFAPTTSKGTSLNGSNYTPLRFSKNPGEYTTSSIYCNAGTAVFGNISLELKISEYRGSDSTHIKIPWVINETTAENGNITGQALGQTFYTLIKDGLTKDNTITKRNFEGIQVTFTGGSLDLYNYILVNKPSTSLTQSKPTFTNLTVTEGYSVVGLFSARNKVSFYKSFFDGTNAYIRCLDIPTTRELCEGSVTGNSYYFCSQHAGDIPKAYYCD